MKTEFTHGRSSDKSVPSTSALGQKIADCRTSGDGDVRIYVML